MDVVCNHIWYSTSSTVSVFEVRAFEIFYYFVPPKKECAGKSTDEPQLFYIVVVTDCKPAIQSLQLPREQLERDTSLHILGVLSQRWRVAVHWILARCGLQEMRKLTDLPSLAADSGSQLTT